MPPFAWLLPFWAHWIYTQEDTTMKKLVRNASAVALLLYFGLTAISVMADDHKDKGADKEMLAEMWIMVPKEGKQEALEQALKEHVKFRKSKNDPREWHAYVPVLGNKLNRLAVRANQFTWADMDSHDEWATKEGISENWQQTADQYVDHYHHYLAVEDHENSHWGPDVEYKYVGVTSYQPKLGHGSAISDDLKTMAAAARAEKWPYNWAFSWAVGGEGELSLAVPYKNWAEMAPPEQKFMEILASHMGSEDEAKTLMERWAGHFEKIEHNIWERRSDLTE